jgi:hypothetical protein
MDSDLHPACLFDVNLARETHKGVVIPGYCLERKDFHS